jgi:hypothetical protein
MAGATNGETPGVPVSSSPDREASVLRHRIFPRPLKSELYDSSPLPYRQRVSAASAQGRIRIEHAREAGLRGVLQRGANAVRVLYGSKNTGGMASTVRCPSRLAKVPN